MITGRIINQRIGTTVYLILNRNAPYLNVYFDQNKDLDDINDREIVSTKNDQIGKKSKYFEIKMLTTQTEASNRKNVSLY